MNYFSPNIDPYQCIATIDQGERNLQKKICEKLVYVKSLFT